uniref:Protochlorophyllide reductase n=1 Tax=Pyramimonas obovata TaxID=1411642 RepID=A0A7S0RIA9_9CHLO|mmetsp:Transcript_35132/g.76777  ORF Transcript_35132/g.76777 Transcript_35132/m.76777 type:complete len:423 (+) Transcript_35132:143-1411(+)|eukprot:CAMPEP_0118923086 /NCGR_PEP_ID=MMETSP1169-20130426/1747_1 /TAXON_ID=36882 /ORGANISM="Pyramimonas obovata, Strain CCMP722" /LENGTH=422 /DNA_ID=CAMNT_0006864027 /DNA_START=139 /DNA_END=1407 /DNA_ORIENTATION=+
MATALSSVGVTFQRAVNQVGQKYGGSSICAAPNRRSTIPKPQRVCCAVQETATASNTATRRTFIQGSISTGLAAVYGGLLLPPGPVNALEDVVPGSSSKNIIITGSNSGIGFAGALQLAAAGNQVFLACRTLAKAQAAKEEIEAELAKQGKTGRVTPVECDMADMASIRKFAADWKASGETLDVLVCNAGVQFSGEAVPRRTKDGFELTVGTNHLGHFLLTNLLLEDLERTPGARIVVTASEVHDPASSGGQVGSPAGLGDLNGFATMGATFDMVDGTPFDSDKAYKDSKLCNVLFAEELQRRLAAKGSGVTVNAFGPGLITRTNFFRYQNPVFVKVFDFATNDIFHVAETVEGGGRCLAYMAADPALEGRGGLYLNNNINFGVQGNHEFIEFDPSEEARNQAEAKTLWQFSADLVGLPSTI